MSGWGSGEWSDMLWGTGADYPYDPWLDLEVSTRYIPSVRVIPTTAVTVIRSSPVYAASIPKQVAYIPEYPRVGTP